MNKAPNLLFITRKWRGEGGMQQLSKDLWQCMENEYGRCAVLCVLPRMRHWIGKNIHLGDAALVPLGWLLKKLGAARVTVTACGLDVIWSAAWYQWLLKRTLPFMDHIVCISHATAEEVRKRGVPEKKISVIPCGVWINHQSPITNHQIIINHQSPKLILLTVGRLVKRKGHGWFIANVLPILIQKYPKLQYWIVGEGVEQKNIEFIVQRNKFEHYVRLLGAVTDSVREDLYAKADCFVMPNIPIRGDMEGFGIACIEASSRGVPVVAARLEGLQDAVIEGETGKFFESENAENCMYVIEEMLNKNLPLPAGEGGASETSEGEGIRGSTLKHFSWPHLFERYRDEVFDF